MNERSTVREKFKRDAFLLVVLFSAGISGMLQPGCGKPVAPSQASTPQSAKAPKQTEILARTREAPQCPPGRSSPNPSSLVEKRDHQVILSWKGSPPADAKHTAAFGYCVYRSERTKDALGVPLNSAPFVGTRCTDDLVENDEKYFYRVLAIDASGHPSGFSNVAVARIPHSKRRKSAGRVPPLCRGADTPQ